MQVCLVLHVRRLPDSSGVVVTSVDFPRLRAEGPDLEQAVARLRPHLVAAVQALDPFDHGTLIAAPVARLLRVPVTIPASKRNPVELALTVGVVVSERKHADGQAYLVRVPGAPGFEFVTTSREDIEPRVAELLPGWVKRWRASSILAVDESDDSYVDLLVLDETSRKASSRRRRTPGSSPSAASTSPPAPARGRSGAWTGATTSCGGSCSRSPTPSARACSSWGRTRSGRRRSSTRRRPGSLRATFPPH